MSEEGTAAPAESGQDTSQDSAPQQVGDTREQAAPDEGHAADEQQEINWQKRYEDLRPEYDKGQAALKEAQQYRELVTALQSDDPQEAAWAADMLGLEFADSEQEDDGDTSGGDEDEFPRDPRVDQLLAEREEQQYEAFLAETEKQIDSQIDEQDKKHSLNLDEKEKELIFARALALPPNAEGLPNVEAAVDEYRGLLDQRIARYRDTKRNAPSPPAPGQSGSNAPDLSDRRARLDFANQVAARAGMREQ